MQVKALKTRVFREGESLVKFIGQYIHKLPERSVVVVTSKIVALAERRTHVIDGANTKEKLVRAESDWAIKTPLAWLTLKDGIIMAAAGIDESNANGKLILLPKDSFKSAEKIRKTLLKKHHLKELGVIITDSRTTTLRAGVVGVAVGYAGFRGIRDYRGKEDIFGRKLKISRTDVADSLATAAVLVMGEGCEQQPLAMISNAPVEFINNVDRSELVIPPEIDLYGPLFSFPK